MEVKAYAKLNLTLDILRKREDGYHDLQMVMQSIALSDDLRITPAAGEGSMSTNLSYLPADGRNLAQLAAAAFRETTGLGGEVDIAIEKHIPVCAGMGGGSSDAAAVLRAMNELTGAGLSVAELAKIGEKVGSDVPYCVMGGTALAEILFGEVSPSGKLPLTFYRNEALAEMPDFTDYSMENRTYRYYTGEPLYPFGYGLTYGDVTVTGLSATKESAVVTVETRGEATEEVVQLYMKDIFSEFAPPNPILCGFRRVFLAEGEKKTVSIPIDPKAFTVVNNEGQRICGSGSWTLYAGLGQPDGRTETLTGKQSLSITL